MQLSLIPTHTPKGRSVCVGTLSLSGTHTDMHTHTPMYMYLPMHSGTQMHIYTGELHVGHQRDRLALTLGCPIPFQKLMKRPVLSRMVTCESGVHRDQGSPGVCMLGVETVTYPEEWGKICLSMRTEELPPH